MTRMQVAKLWRLGLVVTLSLSLAYGLLLILVRCRESVVRSRSEAMYAEFLKLRLGETTKADIEVLRRRFAGSLNEGVDCGDDTRCGELVHVVPINPARPRSHALLTAHA